MRESSVYVFSSSVVQEHNPIGQKSPRRSRLDFFHEFNKYFAFANAAAERHRSVHESLSKRLSARE
jgi:hypothetical protein